MTDPSTPIDDDAFSDDEGEESAIWQSLPPEREFFASPYDPPIKALVQEIRERELNVRPSFQRNAVWDPARKSKFVESILLNIPIPTLFFAQDADGTKVVVDGQQRLLALKEFMENQFGLRGLEVLAPLNGKRFQDLMERQQRIISNRTLRCLVISAKSDSDIQFEVFERLNQGGLPLNAQEVRHCVYRGVCNDLLHELAKHPSWLRLLGRNAPYERMLDCELILRFLAIRAVLPNYAPPLKKLLNSYMLTHRQMDSAEKLRAKSLFLSAVEAVGLVFPDKPFRRLADINGARHYDKSLNRAVFDVQMQLFAGIDTTWVAANRDRIRGAFDDVCLSDQRFADSLSRATADKTRLSYRIRAWAARLTGLGAALADGGIVPSAKDAGES